MAIFGRTLIVVLDDSRARFFKRESSGEFTGGMPELASGMDRNASGLGLRTEKRRLFVQAVIAALEKAAGRGEWDRLMVVGPERMLSAFRKAAPDRVRVRLWREAAMEVEDVPAAELQTRLAPHFR